MEKKKSLLKYIEYFCFIFMYAVTVYYTYTYVKVGIAEDDLAADMILAKILSMDGGFFSKRWFYSTEIHVIHTYMVYSPLFRIFKDWDMVLIIGNAIIQAIFLASLYYLCVQIKLKKVYPLIGILFCSMISIDYHMCVIYAGFYLPYLIVAFLFMGMFFQYLNSKIYWKKRVLLIVSVILSFFIGLSGPRHLFVLYIPLMLTLLFLYGKDCWKKEWKLWTKSTLFRPLFFVLINCVVTGIGYVINSKILSKYYSFQAHGGLLFSDTINWSRLGDFLYGWLQGYGYRGDRSVLSTAIVYNSIAILMIIILIVCIRTSFISNKVSLTYRILSIFYLAGFITFAGLYTLTDQYYASRYYMFITLYGFFIIQLYVIEADVKEKTKKVLYYAVMLILIICSLNLYREEINRNKAEGKGAELREIVNVLEANGYTEGYATWGIGNVLTVLSDSAIEEWILEDEVDLENALEIRPWLQPKNHETELPEGKIFVAFTVVDQDLYTARCKMDEDHLIYSSERYVIYGYESYSELLSYCQTQ